MSEKGHFSVISVSFQCPLTTLIGEMKLNQRELCYIFSFCLTCVSELIGAIRRQTEELPRRPGTQQSGIANRKCKPEGINFNRVKLINRLIKEVELIGSGNAARRWLQLEESC